MKDTGCFDMAPLKTRVHRLIWRCSLVTPSSLNLLYLLYLQQSILHLQHKCSKNSYFPLYSFLFTVFQLESENRFVYTARISLPWVTDEKD